MGYHSPMVRVVGTQDRSEWIRDPAQALRRGRVLDRMLSAAVERPQRGVTRITHREMNKADDQRQLAMARRLNTR